MIPVTFPEHNCVYGAGQEEYQPLPVHRSRPPYVTVTSCWQLTAEEIDYLRQHGGRIWVQQLTFGSPLQPQLVSVEKPEL